MPYELPRIPTAEVLARTERLWDLTGLPVPKGEWLRCPVCSSDEIIIRYWKHHVRHPPSTHPYRVDISLKCAGCACVWGHGIALPESYWLRLGKGRENVRINYRDAVKRGLL